MTWLLRIGALLAVLAIPVVAYKAGEKNGARDIVAQIEKARAASVAEKERIDREINELDRDELLRRALGHVRSPGR